MRLPVAALLVLLALAAGAAADHVYTHRYVVSGRVLAEDGTARAGVPVEVIADGVSSLRGDCRAYRDEMRVRVMDLADPNRTNSAGDFEACVHAHGFRVASDVRLRVGSGPAKPITFDAGPRITFVSIQRSDEGNATTDPRADALLLRVRVWRPSEAPLVLDGVRAVGEALPGVEVRWSAGVGSGALLTDRYGDAALYVDVPKGARGNVTLATDGAAPVDIAYGPGAMRAEAILRVAADDFARGVGAGDPPPAPTPAAGAFLAAGLAALAAAARRR